MTLVLFLVYCKYFNVLFFGHRFLSRRKIFAKLQLLFLSAKLFKIYFCFSLRKTPSPGFRLRRFSQHLPESECKITAFFFTNQIFSDVFFTLSMLKFIKELFIHLISSIMQG